MAISSNQVIQKLKCPYLELVKGAGYWYFVYDDIQNNIYETYSVYVYRLNQLGVDQWVEIGKEFLATIEGRK